MTWYYRRLRQNKWNNNDIKIEMWNKKDDVSRSQYQLEKHLFQFMFMTIKLCVVCVCVFAFVVFSLLNYSFLLYRLQGKSFWYSYNLLLYILFKFSINIIIIVTTFIQSILIRNSFKQLSDKAVIWLERISVEWKR